MREVTVTNTYKVYTFDELSEEAKEKFIEAERDSEMESIADEFFECMKEAMYRLNIDIDDYQLDYTVSGYINLHVDDDAEELEGVRAYTWIVNNLFANVRKNKLYWIESNFDKQRYSNIESKDWMENCPFSGVCYDYTVKFAWDYWCAELKSGLEPSVRDFLDELETQYLKELSDEYYGFGEDEARDIVEANNYEFLEDGTIF